MPEMKVTYYALQSIDAGERGMIQRGDLIPEANSWNFLPGYVSEGKIAPVLVSTLSAEDQEWLEDWEADKDKAAQAQAKAAAEPNVPQPTVVPDHMHLHRDDSADDETEEPSVDGEEVESYDEFTVDQLKEELDHREVEYKSNAKKAELIELLEADDAAADDE